jgi:hypothetical protein
MLNRCLTTLYENMSTEEEHIVSIHILNNHTNFSMADEFKTKNNLQIIHNNARPDFSTGHLSRSWNQAILHGIKDIKNPDCDVLILSQNDAQFLPNFLSYILQNLSTYNYMTFGGGDECQVMTPSSIDAIGMYDERFCNIGFQEYDYLLRAALVNKDKSSINDIAHNRILNPIENKVCTSTIKNEEQAYNSDLSLKYHHISLLVFHQKWNDKYTKENLENFFYKMINSEKPRIPKQYIMYPYFECFLSNLGHKYNIFDPVLHIRGVNTYRLAVLLLYNKAFETLLTDTLVTDIHFYIDHADLYENYKYVMDLIFQNKHIHLHYSVVNDFICYTPLKLIDHYYAQARITIEPFLYLGGAQPIIKKPYITINTKVLTNNGQEYFLQLTHYLCEILKRQQISIVLIGEQYIAQCYEFYNVRTFYSMYEQLCILDNALDYKVKDLMDINHVDDLSIIFNIIKHSELNIFISCSDIGLILPFVSNKVIGLTDFSPYEYIYQHDSDNCEIYTDPLLFLQCLENRLNKISS